MEKFLPGLYCLMTCAAKSLSFDSELKKNPGRWWRPPGLSGHV